MAPDTPSQVPAFIDTLNKEHPHDRHRRHLAELLSSFRQRLGKATNKQSPLLLDMKTDIRAKVEEARNGQIDISELAGEYASELAGVLGSSTPSHF